MLRWPGQETNPLLQEGVEPVIKEPRAPTPAAAEEETTPEETTYHKQHIMHQVKETRIQ